MTNIEALARLNHDMQVRNFAPGSIALYDGNVRRFLEFCDRPVDELGVEDVLEFQDHLWFIVKVAPKTYNSYNATIRFFFATTLGRPLDRLQVSDAKVPKPIPVILTDDEMERILNVCDDLKYKAMFLLGYGSGLRIGEVMKLRVHDIDSDEKRIWVRHGKGAKDRSALLPEITLNTLRECWLHFRPHTKGDWMFPGGRNCSGSDHITDRAIDYAFKKYVRLAGITKTVSFHTLRHTFATRLLESGVDLHTIMILMGHSSITSTTIYLRAANTTKDVVSPADRLFGKK